MMTRTNRYISRNLGVRSYLCCPYSFLRELFNRGLTP
jgi:hypothetical protein